MAEKVELAKLPVVLVQKPVGEKAGGAGRAPVRSPEAVIRGAGAVMRPAGGGSVAVVLRYAIEPLVQKGIAVVTTMGTVKLLKIEVVIGTMGLLCTAGSRLSRSLTQVASSVDCSPVLEQRAY